MEQVREVREGNGSEARRQASKQGTQLFKIRASKDSKAWLISEKQEDLNRTDIWGKHYSKVNDSLVNGENRGTVSNSGGQSLPPMRGFGLLHEKAGPFPSVDSLRAIAGVI